MLTSVASHGGVEVRAVLPDPLLDVMNFLNEAVLDYLRAVSSGPGRPPDSTVTADGHEAAVANTRHRAVLLVHFDYLQLAGRRRAARR